MEKYVGNINQIYGVDEMRLSGGKGDGMRMLCVRNGKGLEIWISLDRCADMARLSFKGENYGYFAPCGFVSPKYYDDKGAGFLKSFTAVFAQPVDLLQLEALVSITAKTFLFTEPSQIHLAKMQVTGLPLTEYI